MRIKAPFKIEVQRWTNRGKRYSGWFLHCYRLKNYLFGRECVHFRQIDAASK